MARADGPTDAELVALVRAGDRSAGASLLDRHEGLSRLAVRKLGPLPARVERDDLLQAGRLALYRAAVSPPPDGWDPAGRAKFSTFAYQAVWWAVLGVLRASGLSEATGEDLAFVPSRPDPDESPRPAALPAGLLDVLSGEEREAVCLVYGVGREAVSVREAARVLGVSYSSAQCLLRRAEYWLRLHAAALVARPANGVAE